MRKLFQNTTRLQKLFIGLGTVFASLILVALTVTFYISVSGMMFDRSSATYAEEAATAIIANWDPKEMEQRSHPQLLQTINERGGVEKLFSAFRKLGALESAPECRGESYSRYFASLDRMVTAVYACKAQFRTGPAIAKLELFYDANKGWEIAGFYVDSAVFRQKTGAEEKK